MSVSQKRHEQIIIERRKAVDLVKAGYSYREVGKMLGKSRGWVNNAVAYIAELDRLNDN